MRASLLLLALLLAACGPSETADAPADDTVVVDVPAVPAPEPTPADTTADADALTADGWGPLTIGMSRAEVVEALGDAPDDVVTGPEPSACEYFHPVDAPDGLLVMLVDGSLDRISLTRDAEVTTAAGVGLGATRAEVEAAVGPGLEATPHKYLEAPGAYLDAWEDGPGSRGVRYEVGLDGTVEAVHAGGPSIQNVEGCA